MKRSLCLPIFFLSLLWLPAQVSYTSAFYPAAGNPGGVNLEADFTQTSWTVLLNGSLTSNQWSSPVSLPFYFEFFGQQVTGVKATANGLLTFTTAATQVPGNNSSLPTSALPDKTIACFWEEFSTSPPTGTNDQVQTRVFGTAPNRQFWIRWSSFEWGPCSFAFVAVVLDETTFKVHLVDMYGSLTSNQVTSTVGLQRASNFAVQSGGNTIALSGAGSSYTDNSYYTFTPYIIPPQDLVPVALISPAGDGCDLGLETVSLRFTNQGQLDATGIQASFSVDGGTPSPLENVPGNLGAGDSLTYTFTNKANLSTPGQHTLKVWVKVAGDANAANDTLTRSLIHVLQVSSFPYRQTFEAGQGGWMAGGVNSSWEMGIPAKPRIQGAASGQKAWVTGRINPYNNLENSWVISPCFDLANTGTDVWIGMKVWWESETGQDGAMIQGSADGGTTWVTLGSPNQPEWYNSNFIGSQPGGQASGWSGLLASGTGPGGWTPVICKLPASLAGQPSVRFRVVFASNAATNSDGFAFDDVIIGTPPVVELGASGYFCQNHVLSAGGPNYTYLWSTGATTPAITLVNTTGSAINQNLITVRVQDSTGLFRRDSILVSMTVPLSTSTASTTQINCYGQSTGAIDIQVAGGLSPLYYAWSNGATSQDLSGLPAGTYSGTLSDANGCSIPLPQITLTQNTAIQLQTPVISDVSCYGLTDGSISASATGGVGGYTYSWSTGTGGNILNGLAAGAYILTVQDALGCEKAIQYTVDQPDSLIVAAGLVVAASCPGSSDGRVKLEISGGTTPYYISWSNGDSGDSLYTLAPGSYDAEIVDARHCPAAISGIEIAYTDTLPRSGFDYDFSGGTVGFQDTSSGAKSWFWDFGDGFTSTQANPVHTFASNGVFQVKQVVINDCGTDTSYASIEMTKSGIGTAADFGMRVYPNPGQGQLWISLSKALPAPGELRILTTDGRILHRLEIAAGTTEITCHPDPAPAAGMYILQLIQGNTRNQTLIEIQ
ncbi:MAG: hypothetical protein EAZ89_11290 [Bacteroidetes bacterium]|nr:MAG: hypothetical protein EAZ89_11290 [Bacteroidota bacterium]